MADASATHARSISMKAHAHAHVGGELTIRLLCCKVTFPLVLSSWVLSFGHFRTIFVCLVRR